MSIGPCRLCGVVSELRSSHILPDFFIRSVERHVAVGNSGGTQPHSTLLSTRPEVTSGERQRGYWERILGMKESLLCGDCEQKFSRYEGYVRTTLYGATPGPSLRKVPLGADISPSPAGGTADSQFLGARLVPIDYRQFKLFVLSIFWRANIARGSFFQRVNLGPYESILQQCLVAEDPFTDTDYPILLIDLKLANNLNGGLEDMIEEPDRARDDTGKTVYSWKFGGFFYVVFLTSQSLDSFLMPFTLKQAGSIIVATAEATSVMQWWAQRLGGRLPR